ncbi:MAG: SLC13/DASS family transporter, partial [Nitrospinota bacterium]|nr:SLC13/DASS family transporter [Nitrospinota bacterium]
MSDEELTSPQNTVRMAGLIGGVVASALFLYAFDLDPAHPEITRTAAVVLLMAIWWITDAVPLWATALLPVF